MTRSILGAALLLVVAASCQSQTKEIRIPGIPFPLQWENGPVKVENKGGMLVMHAGPKTDMFRDPNVTYNTDNAPKLMFRPDEDFVFSASVSHPFESKWDGGALVLKNDSLHWIKFCYEKDYTGARRIVTVVTTDVSDDSNGEALTADKVYFKIAKAGPVITLYYGTDNKNWFLVRHLQFRQTDKLRIGFLAQSPTGDHCTVTFGDIRYEHKTIKDPYVGE